MPPAHPIVIVGPTAGGKSELAVALAEAIHASGRPVPAILGADSMQVYRGLEVGTAKPAADLRARVPHHLIDIVEPSERFTVADWFARAEALIADLASKGSCAIVVGGTNLYIKALLEGLFEGPSQDEALRAQLADLDSDSLHARLARVDPEAAARIHRNDRKKAIRAIEVHHLTGKPISALQTQWSEGGPSGDDAPGPTTAGPYRHGCILIGLDWPVEAINRRINARVKAMFDPASAGLSGPSLPDEVRALHAASRLGTQASLALGYRQCLDHLAGKLTLDEACEETKIATRRFAKQQRTWLKRYRAVTWLSAAERTMEELVSQAMEAVRHEP